MTPAAVNRFYPYHLQSYSYAIGDVVVLLPDVYGSVNIASLLYGCGVEDRVGLRHLHALCLLSQGDLGVTEDLFAGLQRRIFLHLLLCVLGRLDRVFQGSGEGDIEDKYARKRDVVHLELRGQVVEYFSLYDLPLAVEVLETMSGAGVLYSGFADRGQERLPVFPEHPVDRGKLSGLRVVV